VGDELDYGFEAKWSPGRTSDQRERLLDARVLPWDALIESRIEGVPSASYA
jgi:hypothetical protein